MPSNLWLAATLLLLFSGTAVAVGVNWGTAASHPLSADTVVELLKLNNFTKVRLSEPEPLVLKALSGSNLGVTVGLPNDMLRAFNSSKKAAQSWVHDNVTRYISNLRIEYVAVGDEPFLQSYGNKFHPYVIGAATNIQDALQRANLGSKVRVVIPCSSDAFLSESGLPSEGHFRPDLNKTMSQLLTFLTKHGSPFFATISPFLTFRHNKNISLDFALFKDTAKPRNDTRGRSYRNSFDLSYDTLVAALGSRVIDIVVAQIGWPTDGAPNATPPEAEAFVKGLMEHLRNERVWSPFGPRRRPLETYILGLLDEDRRDIVPGGGFERHWGVFTFDGQAKYRFDFGLGPRSLVNAQDVQYLPAKWCVVNDNEGLANASSRAMDACSNADCTVLAYGGSCSNISWPGNVSYAFNSYYQQHDQSPESCDFGGQGLITTVNPSVGDCRFPVGLGASSSQSVEKSSVITILTFVVAAILVVC